MVVGVRSFWSSSAVVLYVPASGGVCPRGVVVIKTYGYSRELNNLDSATTTAASWSLNRPPVLCNKL